MAASSANANATDKHDGNEYLERSGVGVYIQDALTLLLENRPEHPIMFLVEYFQAADKVSSPLSRAYRYIRMTPRGRPAYLPNLASAFTVLNTMRSGQRPCGLTGRELTKLLYLLSNEFPVDVVVPLMRRLRKFDSDLIDIPTFTAAINACLIYEELFDKLEWLFKGCDPQSTGMITRDRFAEIVQVMELDGDCRKRIASGKRDDPAGKAVLTYRQFLSAMLQLVDLPMTTLETDADPSGQQQQQQQQQS
ncbi:EF-hand domain-containing protein [Plasmodiophora brassicae]|uniref:Tubulin polyglutamylase complex subunit 1-like C-terminal domain-containing protein n=1 Tax=Plasmodiophora brassicae TaxID=37360 RepID=A0A0G4IR49_PLABS|nr:hypothetical protein PBRA_000954 [Plasmodiophora brassicae]SPQ97907.1 unnamed protein product [Plasmodiophora brassicae]